MASRTRAGVVLSSRDGQPCMTSTLTPTRVSMPGRSEASKKWTCHSAGSTALESQDRHFPDATETASAARWWRQEKSLRFGFSHGDLHGTVALASWSQVVLERRVRRHHGGLQRSHWQTRQARRAGRSVARAIPALASKSWLANRLSRQAKRNDALFQRWITLSAADQRGERELEKRNCKEIEAKGRMAILHNNLVIVMPD